SEDGVTGRGPSVIRVSDVDYSKAVLQEVYFFKSVDQEGDSQLMERGEGGNDARIIVEHTSTLPRGRQGFGTIHHVAFRVDDKQDLEKWIERYQSFRVPNSGFVERYYFGSLYANIAPGVLFELATDGPGFMGDEPY